MLNGFGYLYSLSLGQRNWLDHALSPVYLSTTTSPTTYPTTYLPPVYMNPHPHSVYPSALLPLSYLLPTYLHTHLYSADRAGVWSVSLGHEERNTRNTRNTTQYN